MKKLILIICLMISTISFLSAEVNSTIYVIFTSTENEISGVWHSVYKNNPEFYRSAPQTFDILDRSKDYFFQFAYLNWNDKPDNPIVSETISFLETVEYIDWDVIGPTLTKEQAEAKCQEIISHSKIYFIDRNDIVNGTMKMVPVDIMKSRI